ncbi:MAG: pyrroloquinoline quinone-dependent dehydrogenase, partial [Bryobacteraceae bacterium]
IKNETTPYMPPVKATTEQVRDLVAYLSRLDGVQPGPIAAPQEPGSPGIGFARIIDPHPGDWLTYNGRLSGNRYSELTAINRSNVSALVPKWTSSLGHFGLEVTPIVADGVMYVTGANQAFALDALTGREIWHYARPTTPGLVGDAALGSNRGLAIRGDKVFMVTDNAHLIALNRVTGSLVWEAVLPDEPQHYGSTVAPLVVKDMVITGVSGGDRGIRGFLSAYKAATGERVWRLWTIPFRGQPGSETWKEKEPTFGGGATWLTGSYDPETDTLYWPTGNPFPDSDDSERSGDNLFTDCVLALNPDTGKLKWHYQFTPHDIHDWDATEPMLLVDARYQGRDRKLLLHGDRNGFFYVLDRTDGQVLLAHPFVRVTWASGVDRDGRPQLLPGYIPPPGGNMVCPAGEATNWGATAYSPATRLFYLMALEKCAFAVRHGSWTARHPNLEPARKYLRALDIETGKIVWEIPETGTTESKHWSGVLATAGGLLFYGDPSGAVVAVDERDGKALWHFPTTDAIKASPMTYSTDGKQFVAIAAGATILCFGLP